MESGTTHLDIMMTICKHHDVRTTLTLDEDVAKSLKREMRRSGTNSLKAAVNHFLRLGLMFSGKRPRKPFVVQPRPMGLPAGLNYDSVEELLEALEGPAHK
jgi:hypothetical protein